MAEKQTIEFELVSPEHKLVEEPVTLVVIPGEEGEFGVGPGHTSLVASLRPGVVALYTDGAEEPRRIFVASGFADVTGELCTILAEEAVNVNDLDKEKLEQSIRDLNEDLGLVEEKADRMRVERQLVLTKAKLSAVTGQLVL